MQISRCDMSPWQLVPHGGPRTLEFRGRGQVSPWEIVGSSVALDRVRRTDNSLPLRRMTASRGRLIAGPIVRGTAAAVRQSGVPDSAALVRRGDVGTTCASLSADEVARREEFSGRRWSQRACRIGRERDQSTRRLFCTSLIISHPHVLSLFRVSAKAGPFQIFVHV